MIADCLYVISSKEGVFCLRATDVEGQIEEQFSKSKDFHNFDVQWPGDRG